MSMAQGLSAFSIFMPHAFGQPTVRALLKGENQHFIVDEDLGFSPPGDGEHLYLHIQNTGDNTLWVAQGIAQELNVDLIDIGYCGLKDRNAVTSQWYSVYDPKNSAQKALSALESNLVNCRILAVSRGQIKLRRGMHRGNNFTITLALDDCPNSDLLTRLDAVKQLGVPNYFGLQRFGREGNNLVLFQEWLAKHALDAGSGAGRRNRKSRKPKGIILSAARSQIFNRVLAQRVITGNWSNTVDGDISLNGFPSAPMWGRGRSASKGLAAEIESCAMESIASWAQALEHLGLNQERRSLVSMPLDFAWNINGNFLILSFRLPPGEYATGVLRELCDCVEPDRNFVE